MKPIILPITGALLALAGCKTIHAVGDSPDLGAYDVSSTSVLGDNMLKIAKAPDGSLAIDYSSKPNEATTMKALELGGKALDLTGTALKAGAKVVAPVPALVANPFLPPVTDPDAALQQRIRDAAR